MSHFWLPAPSWWWTAIFYVTIFTAISLFGFGNRVRRIIFLFACGWIAISMIPALDRQCGPFLPWNGPYRGDQMQITFIDVGHGTSVLIQPPTGEAWLYDAGRLGDAQRSYLGIASVLWEQRLSKIDRLFLSHADSDHFNAIAGLSKRFAIERLTTTQSTLESSSPSLKSTLDQLRQQHVPIELRHAGDVIADGNFRCHLLHPPPEGLWGTDNANSLCMMLEFAGHRILLPGDLEGEGTKRLIAQTKQPVSVLMAPHHGSLAESPKPLLEWCQPKIVIVSGGTRAKHPKVRNAYSDIGRNVLITAVEHAVRCTIDQSGAMRIERWEHPQWVVCGENEGF